MLIVLAPAQQVQVCSYKLVVFSRFQCQSVSECSPSTYKCLLYGNMYVVDLELYLMMSSHAKCSQLLFIALSAISAKFCIITGLSNGSVRSFFFFFFCKFIMNQRSRRNANLLAATF